MQAIEVPHSPLGLASPPLQEPKQLLKTVIFITISSILCKIGLVA